jgi:hypothetical protein
VGQRIHDSTAQFSRWRRVEISLGIAALAKPDQIYPVGSVPAARSFYGFSRSWIECQSEALYVGDSYHFEFVHLARLCEMVHKPPARKSSCADHRRINRAESGVRELLANSVDFGASDSHRWGRRHH